MISTIYHIIFQHQEFTHTSIRHARYFSGFIRLDNVSDLINLADIARTWELDKRLTIMCCVSGNLYFWKDSIGRVIMLADCLFNGLSQV